MSDRHVALIDLEDIQVRGLAGQIKRKWKPKRVELEMTTTIGIDAEDNRAKVDVNLELYGREGTDEDAERILTYSGSVSLALIPAKGYKIDDGTEQATSLLEVVWPIARSSLLEHAQRLGMQNVRIPLVMAGETMEKVAEEEPAALSGT